MESEVYGIREGGHPEGRGFATGNGIFTGGVDANRFPFEIESVRGSELLLGCRKARVSHIANSMLLFGIM